MRIVNYRSLLMLLLICLGCGTPELDTSDSRDERSAGPDESVMDRSQLMDLVTMHGGQYSGQIGQILRIDLGGCSGVDDAMLRSLRPIVELRELILAGTDVTDEGLGELSYMQGLEMLDLSRTAVTDDGLRALQNNLGLRWLNLRNTAITDAGLEYLTNHKQLQYLQTEGTEVSDAGFEALKVHIPELKRKL